MDHSTPLDKAAHDVVAVTVSTSTAGAAVPRSLPPNTLAAGAKVMVYGLANKACAKYNGALANVVQFNEARDRWEIELETMGSKHILIKPANICVGIVDTPEQLAARSADVAELLARMGRVSEDKRERREDGTVVLRM